MTDYYIELNNIDIDGDNDADPIEYHFKLVQNLSDKGEIPTTVVEADQPLNNQQLAFSGKTVSIPIEWLIYDNGNDKASGTWGTQVGSSFDAKLGSDIVTIEDQIYYLRRYIHNAELGAKWRLFGGRFTDPDGSGNSEGTPVAINRLNIDRVAENPLRARGQMQLVVGNVVG